MATLDDKLLGEKLHYYCSSSEDEDGDEQGEGRGAAEAAPPPPNSGGANTGPKGVIEDWRRFKQLETEKREEQVRHFTHLLVSQSLNEHKWQRHFSCRFMLNSF